MTGPVDDDAIGEQVAAEVVMDKELAFGQGRVGWCRYESGSGKGRCRDRGGSLP